MTEAISPQGLGGRSDPGLAPAGSLREWMEGRRDGRRPILLDDVVAVLVPLCLDAKKRHDAGERLFLYPSNVAVAPDGQGAVAPHLATSAPTHPRDRVCLAPELVRSGEPGTARATVFAMGAILYEAVTGEHVGPGMRRPRELDPAVPEALEHLIAKALVGDPTHRPDDLGALASALYHVAPSKSFHPPDRPASAVDESAEFEVDVRMSLLPPEETRFKPPMDPFGSVARAPELDAAPPPSRATQDPTARLAALKEQLESDGRPRYVVHKDRMDHGPFSAVELLQQIASGSFRAEDILRDELSGQTSPIGEWEEFGPFAEQANLKREIVAEKKEVAAKEQTEKRVGIAKTAAGAAIVATLLLGGFLWVRHVRGERSDDVNVVDDPAFAGVDVGGGIKGHKRTGGGRGPAGHGGTGGGGGGFPSGLSYEAALSQNNQEVTIGQKTGPDLTDGQLSGPMKNAAFLSGCGAPETMKVSVRVAIKMGRAVGVSVSTHPSDAHVAACVDRAVRGILLASEPKDGLVHDDVLRGLKGLPAHLAPTA